MKVFITELVHGGNIFFIAAVIAPEWNFVSIRI